jgi:hypothetical protein
MNVLLEGDSGLYVQGLRRRGHWGNADAPAVPVPIGAAHRPYLETL